MGVFRELALENFNQHDTRLIGIGNEYAKEAKIQMLRLEEYLYKRNMMFTKEEKRVFLLEKEEEIRKNVHLTFRTDRLGNPTDPPASVRYIKDRVDAVIQNHSLRIQRFFFKDTKSQEEIDHLAET
jgi:hypothetical protein